MATHETIRDNKSESKETKIIHSIHNPPIPWVDDVTNHIFELPRKNKSTTKNELTGSILSESVREEPVMSKESTVQTLTLHSRKGKWENFCNPPIPGVDDWKDDFRDSSTTSGKQTMIIGTLKSVPGEMTIENKKGISTEGGESSERYLCSIQEFRRIDSQMHQNKKRKIITDINNDASTKTCSKPVLSKANSTSEQDEFMEDEYTVEYRDTCNGCSITPADNKSTKSDVNQLFLISHNELSSSSDEDCAGSVSSPADPNSIEMRKRKGKKGKNTQEPTLTITAETVQDERKAPLKGEKCSLSEKKANSAVNESENILLVYKSQDTKYVGTMPENKSTNLEDNQSIISPCDESPLAGDDDRACSVSSSDDSRSIKRKCSKRKGKRKKEKVSDSAKEEEDAVSVSNVNTCTSEAESKQIAKFQYSRFIDPKWFWKSYYNSTLEHFYFFPNFKIHYNEVCVIEHNVFGPRAPATERPSLSWVELPPWYRVTVPVDQIVPSTSVFELIRKHSEPDVLNFAYYKAFEDNVVFFTNQSFGIFILFNRTRNMYFVVNNAIKSIEVTPIYSWVPQVSQELKKQIRIAVKGRWDASSGTLNLSEFYSSEELSDYDFCLVYERTVFKIIVEAIEKSSLKVEVLDLHKNSIRNLEFLTVGLLPLQQLRRIDISQNEIRDVAQLHCLGAFPLLKEINLDKNPVKEIVVRMKTLSFYYRLVQYCVPPVESVDGIQIETSEARNPDKAMIQTDERTKKSSSNNVTSDPAVKIYATPTSKQNFLGTKENKVMLFTNKFLKHYFSLYDSADRSVLKSLYHQDALFSLNVQREEGCPERTQSVLGHINSKKKKKLLFKGDTEIVCYLKGFPETQHDRRSFNVDVMNFTRSLVVLTVSGIFHEKTDNKMNLRSFNKVLVILPSKDSYQIVNEELFLGTTTEEQCKHYKVLKGLATVSTTDPNLSSAGATKNEPLGGSGSANKADVKIKCVSSDAHMTQGETKENTLPSSKQSFLGVNEKKVRKFVKRFLQQYFTLFDSADRSALNRLYHQKALFSLRSVGLNNYPEKTPNILVLNDSSKKNDLSKENSELDLFFKSFPRTEHERKSFSVDLMNFTSSLVVMSISGVYREPTKNLKVAPIRSFSRVFVMVPNKDSFKIVNEQLFVSAATEQQLNTCKKLMSSTLPSNMKTIGSSAETVKTEEAMKQVKAESALKTQDVSSDNSMRKMLNGETKTYTLQPSKQRFLGKGSHNTEEFVNKFLDRYFSIFDLSDRSKLKDLYHEDALFSMSSTRIKIYSDKNRNILVEKGSMNVERMLLKKASEIVTYLKNLPETEHERKAFSIDVLNFTPSLIVLSFSGIFQEVAEDLNATTRSFNRAIVILPKDDSYRIVNEMLFVTDATAEQIEYCFQRANKTEVPTSKSTKGEESITGIVKTEIKFPSADKTVEGIKQPKSGTVTVPSSKKNFFGIAEDRVRLFVESFVDHYFSIFDSPDRSELVDLYHEEAFFSVSGARLSKFALKNRNILLQINSNIRSELLCRGNLEIVKYLKCLPRTEHERRSFNVDLMNFTPSLIVLFMNGVFEEPTRNSLVTATPLRSFTRVFVILPCENTYKIVNEELFVSNATNGQVMDCAVLRAQSVSDVIEIEDLKSAMAGNKDQLGSKAGGQGRTETVNHLPTKNGSPDKPKGVVNKSRVDEVTSTEESKIVTKTPLSKTMEENSVSFGGKRFNYIPSSKKTFFGKEVEKAQLFVFNFMENYFSLFDSEDRSALLRFYHECAIFSLNADRMKYYAPKNWKALEYRLRSAWEMPLCKGNSEIIKYLKFFPKTIHLKDSFSVDVMNFTTSLVVICISGVFKEMEENVTAKGIPLRFFNRVFCLLPSKDPYTIVNDSLMLFRTMKDQREDCANMKACFEPKNIPINCTKTTVNVTKVERQENPFDKRTSLKTDIQRSGTSVTNGQMSAVSDNDDKSSALSDETEVQGGTILRNDVQNTNIFKTDVQKCDMSKTDIQNLTTSKTDVQETTISEDDVKMCAITKANVDKSVTFETDAQISQSITKVVQKLVVSRDGVQNKASEQSDAKVQSQSPEKIKTPKENKDNSVKEEVGKKTGTQNETKETHKETKDNSMKKEVEKKACTQNETKEVGKKTGTQNETKETHKETKDNSMKKEVEKKTGTQNETKEVGKKTGTQNETKGTHKENKDNSIIKEEGKKAGTQNETKETKDNSIKKEVEEKTGTQNETKEVRKKTGTQNKTKKTNKETKDNSIKKEVEEKTGTQNKIKEVGKKTGTQNKTKETHKETKDNSIKKEVEKKTGTQNKTKEVRKKTGTQNKTKETHKETKDNSMKKEVEKKTGTQNETKEVGKKTGTQNEMKETHKENKDNSIIKEVGKKAGTQNETKETKDNSIKKEVEEKTGTQNETKEVRKKTGTQNKTKETHKETKDNSIKKEVEEKTGTQNETKEVGKKAGTQNETKEVGMKTGTQNKTQGTHKETKDNSITKEVEEKTGTQNETKEVGKKTGTQNKTKETHKETKDNSIKKEVEEKTGTQNETKEVRKKTGTQNKTKETHKETKDNSIKKEVEEKTGTQNETKEVGKKTGTQNKTKESHKETKDNSIKKEVEEKIGTQNETRECTSEVKSESSAESMVGSTIVKRTDIQNELCGSDKQKKLNNDESGASLSSAPTSTVAKLKVTPVSKKIFCGASSEEALLFIHSFLEHYFCIFDSPDRSLLLDLYHENALFSLSGSRLMNYSSKIRNILLRRNPDERENLLCKGNSKIITCLKTFSKTMHKIESFNIDLINCTHTLIVLCVSGTFNELQKTNVLTRSFNRVFVIMPGDEGWRIVNEELYVSNATKEQFEAISHTKTEKDSILSIGDIMSEEDADSFTKYLMIETLVQITGLIPVWALKCLQDNNWNVLRAVKVFKELHEQQKIPKEAYQ